MRSILAFGLVFLNLNNTAVLWPRNLFWFDSSNSSFFNIWLQFVLHGCIYLQLKYYYCINNIKTLKKHLKTFYKVQWKVVTGGWYRIILFLAEDCTVCSCLVTSKRSFIELLRKAVPSKSLSCCLQVTVQRLSLICCQRIFILRGVNEVAPS